MLHLPRPAVAVAVSALLALTTAACSTGSTASPTSTSGAASEADASAYPVTIEHTFGATTIDEEPTRVVTLGWSDHDMVLSLGVVPVGATKLTWGGNDAGSSDWFDAALEDLGGTQPTRLDDTDGAPVTEIAQLEPDLILATNSGLTKKEYTKLSKIADVVAYPGAPWVTSWQDSLDLVGQALGRSELAAEVRAETESTIEDAKSAYPQLEGTSLVFAWLSTADLSSIGIYGAEDNRTRILKELGMVDAPIVEEAVAPGEFYGTVSAERAADVESDVFLTYAEQPDDLETYRDDKLLGQIPALRSGNAYAEMDKHVGLSITNPTPLAIPFLIENFLPQVAAAADGS